MHAPYDQERSARAEKLAVVARTPLTNLEKRDRDVSERAWYAAYDAAIRRMASPRVLDMLDFTAQAYVVARAEAYEAWWQAERLRRIEEREAKSA